MNTHFNEPLLSESYGFLDDKEKDNIISALDSENFFQAEIDNELKYSHKKGWSIAFGNHLAAYGAYSDDIVKLTLLGNSPFSNIEPYWKIISKMEVTIPLEKRLRKLPYATL